jgi:hypothetical protein
MCGCAHEVLFQVLIPLEDNMGKINLNQNGNKIKASQNNPRNPQSIGCTLLFVYIHFVSEDQDANYKKANCPDEHKEQDDGINDKEGNVESGDFLDVPD